jgi:trehalose monomycolate/heme transporter
MLSRVLERIAGAVVRRRTWVLVAGAAVTRLAAFAGHGLFGRLGYSLFADPSSESARAAALARAQLGEGDPDVVALYSLPRDVAPRAGARDPAVRDAIARALAEVARDPAVARVMSDANVPGERFTSRDGRAAFAVVSLRGDPRAKAAALTRLQPRFDAGLPGGALRPELGGLVPSGRALTRLAERSLARGERIALPLTGILLCVIFGSVVAALVPLALGGLSIVLALGVLDVLSRVAPIDAFAVNVVTILGLGVAIDYALFLVSRVREERARAHPRPIARAVATAGRTVLFSGVTVATSLGGLLVFRQPLLRSIAIGGAAVVLLAAALAVIVLPAGLALLGPRLELGRLRRRESDRATNHNIDRWRRLARAATRRPVAVAVGVTALLLVLGAPLARLQPSRADVRSLPAHAEPRLVSERIQRDFPAAALTPLSVVVTFDDGDAIDETRLAALYDYTARLAALPDVARVDSVLSFAGAHDRASAAALSDRLEDVEATGGRARAGLRTIVHGRYTLVRVISTAPPDSPAGRRQVDVVRAVAPPDGARAAAFGQAAALHDFAHGLRARAPWMLALVGAAMFVVLLLAFRSLVLPLKAMLMTALSLTASFGAIVFVFQDGRFERLLAYESLGTIDASLPVVMFAVVFGLSMDYEVLILGRMRESWLRTHENQTAVTEGLAQTGRLVTGAALLMVVVFSAFAAAPVVFVKALGLGMALAVALDATVVRMLLVPATMALLGRLNWWFPQPYGLYRILKNERLTNT